MGSPKVLFGVFQPLVRGLEGTHGRRPFASAHVSSRNGCEQSRIVNQQPHAPLMACDCRAPHLIWPSTLRRRPAAPPPNAHERGSEGGKRKEKHKKKEAQVSGIPGPPVPRALSRLHTPPQFSISVSIRVFLRCSLVGINSRPDTCWWTCSANAPAFVLGAELMCLQTSRRGWWGVVGKCLGQVRTLGRHSGG